MVEEGLDEVVDPGADEGEDLRGRVVAERGLLEYLAEEFGGEPAEDAGLRCCRHDETRGHRQGSGNGERESSEFARNQRSEVGEHVRLLSEGVAFIA